MVSLSLMARLLEAVRDDARVVLVGDPGQLTAIEAGAVLRDIVGPASDGLRVSAPMRALLEEAVGRFVVSEGSDGGFGDGIIVLERVHRYGEGIARIAEAVRRGDAGGTIAALRAARPAKVVWLPVDVAGEDLDVDSALGVVRAGAVASGRAVLNAAADGDARSALAALWSFRLLCAHRRGPHGVAAWTAQIERWLADAVPEFDAGERDYVGRPLLVTRNDYELGLYNGDTGVIVGGERLMAAFERGGGIVSFSADLASTPSRPSTR